MPKQRLDPKLLQKLAKKVRKSTQYLREQISKRASKNGIASEAALIILCRELGIGIANYLRKQPSHIQDQVRSSLTTIHTQQALVKSNPKRPSTKRGTGKNQRAVLQAAINYLMRDQELLERCQDLLMASKHFDRVFREATTVFDDRLKQISGIKKMNPLDLVGKTLNPNPQKAVIVVSSENSEQEGFHGICKGMVLAFRDTTHHKLSNKFTREDALKFCGFVDTVLSVLNQASIHPERV